MIIILLISILVPCLAEPNPASMLSNFATGSWIPNGRPNGPLRWFEIIFLLTIVYILFLVGRQIYNHDQNKSVYYGKSSYLPCHDTKYWQDVNIRMKRK